MVRLLFFIRFEFVLIGIDPIVQITLMSEWSRWVGWDGRRHTAGQRSMLCSSCMPCRETPKQYGQQNSLLPARSKYANISRPPARQRKHCSPRRPTEGARAPEIERFVANLRLSKGRVQIRDRLLLKVIKIFVCNLQRDRPTRTAARLVCC